jgi:hypothetical protein
MTATATARCRWISYDNLRGNECELTGASVGADCGAPRDDDAAGECIPRQSLCYLRGDRAAFAALPRADRDLVMATATKISGRMKAGVIHRETPTKEAAMGETDLMDLSNLTPAQLLELARRARQQAKLREQADQRKGQIVPALRSALLEAEARHTELRVALVAAEEGKPVDLKALRVRVGRGAQMERPPSGGKGQRRELTPEKRFAIAERIIRRKAAAGKWPRKRLEESLLRARQKAGAA